MRHLLLLPALACLLIPTAVGDKPKDADELAAAPGDWPWWRGPTRDGVAEAKQAPPLTWGEKENVLWHADLPGRGHGSPAVVGDRVFLATADEEKQTQSVLCLSRKDGKLLWQTVVHEGKFVKGGNAKSSHASSTPACDGERVFINFANDGAVFTTALGLDGKQLWQTKVADYVMHQGYGSSPIPYRSLVLVSADNKGGKGAVAALERATGKVVWRHQRPKLPNYASPIVLKADGRDQVVMTGCDRVVSYEPLSGKELWDIKGSTEECVTSTVTDGKHVYTSGGYPRNHVSAVVADGSGKVAWENGSRVYVPSMVVRDGHLYAVQDDGTAVCWKSDTGKEVWKKRLGGTFSSSLVLVGEQILASNEAGQTFVFGATPDGYAEKAKNQLGKEMMATAAVCGGRLYLRVASKDKGKRQEVLYCVGKQ
jgi:hypothetical protein